MNDDDAVHIQIITQRYGFLRQLQLSSGPGSLWILMIALRDPDKNRGFLAHQEQINE